MMNETLNDPSNALLLFVAASIMVVIVIGGGVLMATRVLNTQHKDDRPTEEHRGTLAPPS